MKDEKKSGRVIPADLRMIVFILHSSSSILTFSFLSLGILYACREYCNQLTRFLHNFLHPFLAEDFGLDCQLHPVECFFKLLKASGKLTNKLRGRSASHTFTIMRSYRRTTTEQLFSDNLCNRILGQ